VRIDDGLHDTCRLLYQPVLSGEGQEGLVVLEVQMKARRFLRRRRLTRLKIRGGK
jgi:hypothetical protein